MIATIAIGVRVGFALIMMFATHRTLSDWAMLRDGESYLRLARATHGEMSVPTAFDWRVFMGYPFAIGVAAWTGLSFAMSALLVTWISAGISAALAAIIAQRRDVGLAMAILLPSYLMYTSLAMSEALLLLCILGGLLAGLRGHALIAGALLGYAGLVRPMACFAMIGYGAYCMYGRQLPKAILSGTMALAVVVVGNVLWRSWSSGSAQSVALYKQAYGGRLVDWPFATLFKTPWENAVPMWKTAYIYLHVALVLLACILAARTWLRVRHDERRAPFAALVAAWLIGNSIFAVCVGPYWGFHEFHRFLVPALPALWISLEEFFPRDLRLWAVLGVASVLLAAFGVAH